MQLILKITAGILLADAISATMGIAVTSYIAHEATQHFQEVLADQKAQRDAQQRQIEATRQAAILSRRQAELKEQELRQQQLARKRAEDAFDKAFLDQYEPPPSCITPQSDTRWVECVDLKRQAKNEFRARRLDTGQLHEEIKIVRGTP
jgi:hypothetical protein